MNENCGIKMSKFKKYNVYKRYAKKRLGNSLKKWFGIINESGKIVKN